MIIYGMRNRGKLLGQMQVTCPNCHRAAMTGFAESRRWFTLFFIPIFPIGAKNTTGTCGLCGARYAVDGQKIQEMLAGRVPVTPNP